MKDFNFSQVDTKTLENESVFPILSCIDWLASNSESPPFLILPSYYSVHKLRAN